METIHVSKSTLLEVLRKNRQEHRDIFLEAQKNYRALVIDRLDAKLKQARDGSPVHLSELTQIISPQDHTKEYDRAIGMLEMTLDDTILLAEHEYRHFVEDNWEWTRSWAVSNSAYSTSSKVREALNE